MYTTYLTLLSYFITYYSKQIEENIIYTNAQ